MKKKIWESVKVTCNRHDLYEYAHKKMSISFKVSFSYNKAEASSRNLGNQVGSFLIDPEDHGSNHAGCVLTGWFLT